MSDMSQGQGYQGPEISGNWMAGSDTSSNRVELAKTKAPNIYAIRSTHQPERVGTFTRRQILNLANDVNTGVFADLLNG